MWSATSRRERGRVPESFRPLDPFPPRPRNADPCEVLVDVRRRDGGTGRRSGFKIRRAKAHPGSIPGPGISKRSCFPDPNHGDLSLPASPAGRGQGTVPARTPPRLSRQPARESIHRSRARLRPAARPFGLIAIDAWQPWGEHPRRKTGGSPMPPRKQQPGQARGRGDPGYAVPAPDEPLSILDPGDHGSRHAGASQWDGLRRIVDRWIEESSRLDTL